MSEPRQIAIVRSYAELHAALQARAVELGATHEAIDNVSGLQAGYASKLLSPVPIRSLGRVSLGPMLETLGLVLLVVEDLAAMQRHAARLGKGRQPAAARLAPVTFRISLRQLRKRARAGGLARKQKVPAWKLRAIGRKGGRASAAKRAMKKAGTA
jgi:hypothetical protein